MTRKLMNILATITIGVSLAVVSPSAFAQNPNSNTAKGQMKESGKSVGKAGKSLGHNIKHGRVIRGGKHFGKHMGGAGKHAGKSTKITARHVKHKTKKTVHHVTH